MESKLPDHCPGCGSPFTPADMRVPLLLPSCGHHLCWTCVAKTSPSGQVTCSTPSCGLVTHTTTPRSVRLQFPVDFHLLGSLAYSQCQSADQPPVSVPPDKSESSKCAHLALQLGGEDRGVICQECFVTPDNRLTRSDWLARKVCEEHGQPLEFISSESLVPGCALCFQAGDMRVQKYEGLQVVEEALARLGVLQQLARQGVEVLQELEDSQRKVQLQSQKLDQSLKSVELSVSDHLAQCRAELALLGSRVMLEIGEVEEEAAVEKGKVEQELGERISRLRRVLPACEGEGIVANTVGLVQELRHLLGQTMVFNTGEVEVREEVDLSVLERINKCVAVNIDRKVVESVTERDLRESKEAKVIELECEKDQKCHPGSSDGELSAGECLKDFDLVSISFVESPESFYVQKVSDRLLLKKLRVEVENEAKEGVALESILCGDVVGVGCDRVRVEVVEEGVVEVFLMDQGERKTVDRQQMVKLSSSLSSMPALAHHCSLSQVASPAGGWGDSDCSKVIQAMLQYAAGTHCRVKLQESAASPKLLISLTHMQSRDVSGEHAPSMAEYLQYRGLVRLSDEVTRGEERSFIPPSVFYARVTETVLVSHVTSPHLLWVNRGGSYAGCQMRQQETLAKVYRERWGEEGLRVLVPREGQICVTRFSRDKGVYRARVVQLLGLGEDVVKVQFVDYGNTECKQIGDLRQLLNQFLNIPELAVPVSLSDVVPTQGVDWGAESCRQLMERVRNRQLSVHVVREDAGGLCRVVLYEVLPDKDISLNGWLVSRGLAVSDTGQANTVEYVKPRDNTLTTLTMYAGGKDESKSSAADCDVEVVTDVEETEPETGQEYYVLTALSPAVIHLRKLEEAESFHKFSSELSAHYTSTPSVSGDLEEAVSGSCWVARLPGEGWVRVRMFRGSEIELELLDHGRIVKAPENVLLKPLVKMFRRRRFCTTVHISDVVPAGGSREWTVAACCKLTSLLPGAGSSVRLVVRGGPTTSHLGLRSWPVSLLLMNVIGGGPLEPETVEVVSLGQRLMEEGMAIPLRLAAGNLSNRPDVYLHSELNNNSISLPTDFTSTLCPPYQPSGKSLPSTCWTSPILPSSLEFDCTCYHVDWNCHLHVSHSDNKDSLRLIRALLHSKFAGSFPRPTDLYWIPGQDCVALDRQMDVWCRGQVLEVDMEKQTGKVKSVDYGDEYLCQFSDMRKDLFCSEFPAQSFTISMGDIVPRDGGRWEERDLDFLHETVVDQELRVKVMPGKSFPLTALSVITKTGVNIEDFLVSKGGFARRPVIGVK